MVDIQLVHSLAEVMRTLVAWYSSTAVKNECSGCHVERRGLYSSSVATYMYHMVGCKLAFELRHCRADALGTFSGSCGANCARKKNKSWKEAATKTAKVNKRPNLLAHVRRMYCEKVHEAHKQNVLSNPLAAGKTAWHRDLTMRSDLEAS